MNKRINKFLLFTSIFSPTISKAEGQNFLEYISDGLDFLFVFSTWTVGILFLLLVAKAFRKKVPNKRQKLIIWVVGLLLASFHWIMIKHDPYPYSGPIDSFLNRNRIEKARINDSLELVNGKSDSIIESTIASIDTNEVGVYIWLDGKKYFVRKLTTGLNQSQEDSLTMSIVRSWKKK